MARKTSEARTIYGYSLHGRTPAGVVDYVAFFAALAEKPAVERQTSVGDEMVAITTMVPVGHRWMIRFIAGREGIPPLFYDPETGTESFGELGGQVVASVNWILLDPLSRFLAIERRRPGVPVNVMSRSLALMGRELGIVGDRVTIDFNPVVAESFLEELDRYDRIRQAAVTLSRPNLNWLDSAAELTGYAGESNADSVELEMSAKRGESLDKDSGIVADIKELIRRPIGPLKNLRVTGRRENEPKETSMSLKRHQEKRTFPVATQASPLAESETFRGTADGFLDELASMGEQDS